MFSFRHLAECILIMGVVVPLLPTPVTVAADEKACVKVQDKVIEVNAADLPRLIRQGARPADCPRPTLRRTNPNVSRGTATILAETGVDLSLSLSHTPEPVVAGRPVTQTITVRNTGSTAANGVYLRYPIPRLEIGNEPAEFISASTEDGFECSLVREPSPGHVNCVSGDVGAGDTSTIRIQLRAPLQGGSLSGSVTIDPDNVMAEVRDNNNTAVSLITVLGRPDLTVSIGTPFDMLTLRPWLVDAIECIPFGCTKDWVVPITVTNRGESPAGGRVRFDYPDSLSFGGTENPCPALSHPEDGVCANGSLPLPMGEDCQHPQSDFGTEFGAVNCTFPSLEAGQGIIFLVNLSSSSGGQGPLTARIDPGNEVDERRESNNAATRWWQWE